jgi:hypothetical protein
MQFIISKWVEFFRPAYEKFGLTYVNEGGYDLQAPCVFAGMYNMQDVERLYFHKGKKIIVWLGMDSNLFFQQFDPAILKNCLNVAISKNIQEKLKSNGIGSEYIMIPHTDIDFWKPEPLGECVYSYAPNNNYGRDAVFELSKKSPYKFIITDHCKQYTRDQLYEIYKNCFVGLRLRTLGDGNPASIIEMGLMGRKTISNNDSIACIHYEDILQIPYLIDREKEKKELIIDKFVKSEVLINVNKFKHLIGELK